MKSIMAKFRRVTRYVVAVFLAAAACFSGYAGCTYEREERNGQWGWRVRCTFGADEFFPDEEGGGEGEGGGGGSCSNCVSMTPAACAQAQADIRSTAERLGNDIDVQLVRLSSANDYLNVVQGRISAIKNEGEQFEYFSSYPSSVPAQNVSQLSSVPQSSYFSAPTPTGTLASQYVFPQFQQLSLGSSANSIYNYYNDGIKPLLTDIDNGVAMAYTYVNDTMSDLEDLKLVTTEFDNIANNMNCDACTSSGGGGGSGSGTTDSSGCPCASYIVAVQGAVDNVQLKLSEVKTLMDSWDVRFKKWDNYLKSIADAVGPIGTNFIQAVEYRTRDGQSFEWEDEHEKIMPKDSDEPFDFGEFGKLSWFSRIEYLMLYTAGIFSSTNDIPADYTKKEEEKQDELEGFIKGIGYQEIFSELRGLVQTLQGVRSKLNPFANQFSSTPPTRITIFPNVSFGGDTENSIIPNNEFPKVDLVLNQEFGPNGSSLSDFVELAHSLTSFLWAVLCFLLYLVLIIHLVRVMIWLTGVWGKIVNSYVEKSYWR